jgi:DNA mismatch repair ATPase MutS
MQVLLSEALIAAIEKGTSFDRQQQHPATECLLKSSLLKECHLTPIPDSWYSEEEIESEPLLKMLASLKTGEFSALEISAASALLHFVMHTQRSVIPFLSPPSRFSHHQHMAIDANTRRALEIVRSVYTCTYIHRNSPKRDT